MKYCLGKTAFHRAIHAFLLPAAMLMTLPAFAEEPIKLEAISIEALKVETPANETPKSVSITTGEDLDQRQPQKLDEALRYTSGVLSQPFGSDNDTDWIRVRGFEPSIYLDGNRLFKDGFYTWLLEPYGLEQLETVKGPSSILFGESFAGGVVNAVQKKPTDTPQGEIHLAAGNNNLRTLGFDLSDDLVSTNTAKYRFVGTVKSQDGELDGTENDRYYFAPSVSFDFSERTRLVLLASILDDDGVPTNPFFPAYGTLIDAPEGSIDPSSNFGEPDYDKYQRKQTSLGYQLEHDVNDVWTLSQNFNYGKNELFLRSTYAFFSDTSIDVGRGIVFRDGAVESLTLDNRAIGNWATANAEHTVLVGVDLQDHENNGKEQDSFSFGTINTLNPVYGNFTPLDPSNDIDRDITKEQSSIYGQYEILLADQFLFNVGGRHDSVKTRNKSEDTGQNESRNDKEVSLNTGFMYLSSIGVSPYFSYSESFEVLSTIDSATGELYKPLEGEQKEIGLKYTPDMIDGYFTLSYFDITQKNALVTNPNTFIATQIGEVESEGFEFEGVGYITDNLKLSGSYTYTDATTEDTGGQGRKQVALIPKNAASAYIDYRSPIGLNFGTGVRYIGESKDNPRWSDRTVPSYTLWDIMASYEIADVTIQLNVNNVFDKEYVSACDFWCYYGQSRQATLSVNYKW